MKTSSPVPPSREHRPSALPGHRAWAVLFCTGQRVQLMEGEASKHRSPGRSEHTDSGWSHQRSADSRRLHLRLRRLSFMKQPLQHGGRPARSAQPPAPDRLSPQLTTASGPSAHMPQRAEVHLAGGLFLRGPARCLWSRPPLSSALPTGWRAVQTVPGEALVQPCRAACGAVSVSVSSALPFGKWQHWSFKACILIRKYC